MKPPQAKGSRGFRVLSATVDRRLASAGSLLQDQKTRSEEADPEMIEVLRAAIRNIREFHLRQVEASWEFSAGEGVRLGVRNTAIGNVGLYIPGGKAAYPSSVLMNAIPAHVFSLASARNGIVQLVRRLAAGRSYSSFLGFRWCRIGTIA